MKLKVWADSFDCRSGAHCVACRSTGPAGHQFRASIGRAWCAPQLADANGFICPHGQPWDAQQGKSTPMPQGQVGEGGCGCSPPPRE